MTRFNEFVQSPYHNKHVDVQALIRYLTKIYPQLTAKKCDRFAIFQKLFPKQLHDQANLALLFTYAFRLAKEFLSIEQYQAQKERQSLYLLTALRDKEQSNFYQKNFIKIQSQLKETPHRGSPFYWQQFELARESDLYFEPRSKQSRHFGIQDKQQYLDYFYLAEKLKDACELEVRSKIVQVQFDVQFIENILETVKRDWQRYQDVPPIAVYYHLYRMITEEDTVQYYKALPIIEQNSRFFPKKELQDIYTYTQNFCIKQINLNNTSFMKELLKIYKIQLIQKLLQDEKGQLSEWHYKNIVTLGLRLQEQGWVYDFIEKYKMDLPAESRENAYRFNRAAYAYNVADYDLVLELLLQVEHTNIQYSLGARWLILRTYYAKEESNSFFALYDSFRVYLQRNQLLSAFKKEGHEQAIRLMKKAFQIKLDAPYQKIERTQKEIAKLKQEIIRTKTIFNREWLENKVAALDSITKSA